MLSNVRRMEDTRQRREDERRQREVTAEALRLAASELRRLEGQGLIDLLTEADVTYPARATKTELLRLLTLHRQGPYIEFLEAIKRAGAIRTLESLTRIEAGAQGGALVERVTTTRTSKVRERFTPPDWPSPDADSRTPRRAMRPPRPRCPHQDSLPSRRDQRTCEAVGISEVTYYRWQARGNRGRDEQAPTLELSRQELIDLLVEADVPHPVGATKPVLLRLLTLHREDSFLQFLHAIKRAGAIRTLESLARIELASQGGALLERVTTNRTSKTGVVTTTVRERFTPPDWHADGWFLERRYPADWSRRTEFVLPDEEQVKEVDPLVGVHDELRLARLARQKQQGKSV